MPIWRRKSKEKPDKKPEISDLYSNLGTDMKKSLEEANEKAERTLEKGLIKISEDHPSLLPEDVTNKLLSLKTKVDLPPVLFPPSFFEKPRFRGKRDFYERLAIDIIVFGMSYQRSYGTYPARNEFPNLFLKNRNWWDCEPDDIDEALKILLSSGTVTEVEDGKLVFEDIDFSGNMCELLKFVTSDNRAAQGITIDDISDEFPYWNDDLIESLLEKAITENLAVKDSDGKTIYFKAFN
ncbi:MAG: hypothetical protein ACTSP4_07195 [Candidatus Hodarchaeales archaeon]